jgi:hypothetical protein
MAPKLTYQDLTAMFKAVKPEVGRLYERFPRLCKELKTQLKGSIAECKCGIDNQMYENLPVRAPADLLLALIRCERTVFDAFNKHRLGLAPWLYRRNSPAPSNADEILVGLRENIDEDLESFPLRLEAVIRGFDTLTYDLAPIYQGSNRAARPDNSNRKTATVGRRAHYGKLADAPPANLDYPVGNMTLAEMAAFHPDAMKSRDVIQRFIHSGGTQALFADMINHHRAMMHGPITNNTILQSMKCTMKKLPGNAKWNPGVEKQRAPPAGYNAMSVSVTGFTHSGNGKNIATAAPIPIRDLGIGVIAFPSGDDALDLTRAVHYCRNNPDENWMYPDDLQRLVSQLPHDEDDDNSPVGPIPVRPEHQDAAVILRFRNTQTARSRPAKGRQAATNADSEGESDVVKADSYTGSDDSSGDPRSQANRKRKRLLNDSGFDASSGPFHEPVPGEKRTRTDMNTKPKSRASRGAKDAIEASSRHEVTEVGSNSDSDAYVGRKRTKKPAAGLRRSGRTSKVLKTYNIEEALGVDDDDDYDDNDEVEEDTDED